jgi:hypothetical protein
MMAIREMQNLKRLIVADEEAKPETKKEFLRDYS